MTGSVSSNFGLNTEDFYRLSQLEEAVFLAIRKAKITLCEYLTFMCSFIGENSAKFQSGYESGINAENAFEMIEIEKHVGSHLAERAGEASLYIEEFKKFLKLRGIKVNFRKTPLE